MDISDFKTYMVKISLLPYRDQFKFSFDVKVDNKVFLQEYDQFNYTPWKIMIDRFGGIMYVNECYYIYEYQHPFLVNKKNIGKFIIDSRSSYLSWIGFFNSIFSIIKEYKKFKSNIIKTLDQNKVNDEELKNQILNFQFKK